MSHDVPIACNPNALTPEQRRRYGELRQGIAARRRGVTELPAGYAFRYDTEPSLFLMLAEWVTLERLCCPFFMFTLVFGTDELRIELTGAPSVKALIAAEFGVA